MSGHSVHPTQLRLILTIDSPSNWAQWGKNAQNRPASCVFHGQPSHTYPSSSTSWLSWVSVVVCSISVMVISEPWSDDSRRFVFFTLRVFFVSLTRLPRRTSTSTSPILHVFSLFLFTLDNDMNSTRLMDSRHDRKSIFCASSQSTDWIFFSSIFRVTTDTNVTETYEDTNLSHTIWASHKGLCFQDLEYSVCLSIDLFVYDSEFQSLLDCVRQLTDRVSAIVWSRCFSAVAARRYDFLIRIFRKYTFLLVLSLAPSLSPAQSHAHSDGAASDRHRQQRLASLVAPRTYTSHHITLHLHKYF